MSQAFVKKLIDKYGEVIYVSIPFRGNEGAEARLGYLISNKDSRAFAAEITKAKGETSITLYYVKHRR